MPVVDMPRVYLFVLLFLQALTFCHGEEEPTCSLINLTNQPVPRVYGTVNVISGDWVDQAVHIQPNGPDSLPIGHSYISSSIEEGSLGDGWDFFWPSTLETYSPIETIEEHKGEKVRVKPKNSWLIIREAAGGVLPFEGNDELKHFHPKIKKTGHTHVASIDDPIVQDIYRMRFEQSHSDEWHVYLSDGTKRIYEKDRRQSEGNKDLTKHYHYDRYHLVKEVLPSENIRYYSYDKKDSLEEIKTVSSCKKHTIQKITLKEKKDAVIAKSLEGKEVIFHHDELGRHKYDIVKKITVPGAPTKKYDYCDQSDRHIRRIEQRTWSTGLIEEAKFYGDNKETTIEGKSVHQSSDDQKFTKGRVREVRTKRFKGEDTFARHGFYYDKKGSDDYRILTVTEPDGAYTHFMSTDRRILWHSLFDKHKHRLSSEHFLWDEGSKDEGRLIQRALYDSEHKPCLIKDFVFDKHGFPIEEKLHGIMTSLNVPELHHKDHEHAKGGETWRTTAEWDDEGHLLAKKDQEGNWTYFKYDRCFAKAKYVCSKKDIIRREFTSHDSAGNLTEIIHDDGSRKDKDDLQNVTRRTIIQIEPRLKTPYFGEPESKKQLVWVPKKGLLLKAVEHFYRDNLGRVIRHTIKTYDNIRKETSYTYDDLDRVIETVFPDGSREKISYDETTGLVREKRYFHKKIVFIYDLLQRVISEKEVYADGSTFEKTYDYDKSGRIITMRDSRGKCEIQEKDLLGRVIRTTKSAIPTKSGLKTPIETFQYRGRESIYTAPDGASTKTLFSSLGKPLKTNHPEGYSTTYQYDMQGREIERFDGERRITTTYDEKGHVIKTDTWVGKRHVDWQKHTFRGDTCIVTETEGLITHYIYDQFGRCVSTSTKDKKTGQERVEQKKYDGFDRVIKIRSSQKEEQTSYDIMDRPIAKKITTNTGKLLLQETTCYDKAGREIEKSILQDANQWLTTKTKYGAYGLVSSKQSPDGSIFHYFYRQEGTNFVTKTVDPLGIVTEETMTPSDVVTTKTIFSPLGEKISEVRTLYTLSGKPSVINYDVYYQGVYEETITTSIKYDACGHVICLKEAVGTEEEVSTHKSYDNYGRCVEETLPSGTILTSTYDGKGRLVGKKSSDGTIDTSFSYNYQDQVIQALDNINHTETLRTYDGFKNMLKDVQSNGLTVLYEYSSDGLLNAISLPDGSKVHYSYEGGVLTKATRIKNDESYAFNITKRSSSGMVLETALPFALGPVSYTYDLMSRPISKSQSHCSETRTYDLLGRTTSRTIDGVQETFQYDDLSQLISDNGISRDYDSYYRMRKKEGETVSVTRRQQCTSIGDLHFAYDLDGRRTKDGAATLQYDALGRLTSYEKEGSRETYEYDAFMRRMKKSSSASTELYLWLGQHEIGTYSQDGTCTSFRMLAEGVGDEGEASLAIELNGTPYCALSDLSGNVRALLSQSGEVVHMATYSSFDRTSTTGINCPWGYSSKRHDEFTGYIHFLYRLYDPKTSSFITQDPLGLEGGPNLYAYVKNNPASLFDLFGLLDSGTGYTSIFDIGKEIFSDVASAFNNVCSCFSSIGETLFGPSSTPPKEAKSIIIGENTEVYERTYYPTDCFSSSYEHDFETCFNNSQTCRIGVYCNGMMNTKYEAIEATDWMEGAVKEQETNSGKKLYGGFLNMYMETQGLLKDSTEAIKSFGSTITAFEMRATDKYETLFQSAIRYKLKTGKTMIFDNYVHSRGAVNYAHIRSELIRRNRQYAEHFGSICAFGSTYTFPDGPELCAKGDPIPAINPCNIPNLIKNRHNVHSTTFKWQSPFEAHKMMGPAYQEAFRKYINNRLEEL